MFAQWKKNQDMVSNQMIHSGNLNWGYDAGWKKEGFVKS